MHEVVHILNGDSTSYAIKEGGIKGDTIVWREMLVEGPLDKNFGSDAFWKKRYSFFENELGVSNLEYYDKTIKEIIKIKDLTSYNEVVLWFEFDLFCQVNVIALCSYLLQYYRNDINYYLVCTGKEKDKLGMQSLSDYHPSFYSNLLENKIELTRHDLLFAEECWQVYVKNDEYDLRRFNFKKNTKFKYLQPAIDQHLKRFHEKEILNQIGYKILEIMKATACSEKDIIQELLIWQRKETVYGFGDLQYIMELKKLSKFYDIKDQLYYLNRKGKSIIL